jgi:biopolymer transport protein ExbB
MAVWTVLEQGGFMMWVILGVGLFAGGVVVERIISLYALSFLGARRFSEDVARLVEERRYADALARCSVRSGHPLPRVLKAGLQHADRSDREVEKAMESEMLGAIPRAQRFLAFLGLLGNVATLLGLLGTIFGLILAFSGVSAASAADRQAVLAEGISVAMYTTAFGIVCAVPVLFFHNILVSRSEKILVETEEGATRVMAALGRRLRVVSRDGSGRSDDRVA